MKKQKTEKRKRPRTRIWMPALALLFAFAGLVGGLTSLLVGQTPAPAVPSLVLGAVIFLLWRRRAAVDLTLLARTTEKKLARLQKVSGDEALFEVAEKSGEPVRGEALRLIGDRGIFTEKARQFSELALEQITDQEQLAAVAAAEGFFPAPKKKKDGPAYRERLLAFRKRAADRIADAEILARLARGGDELGLYAAEKLLREQPERARELCADGTMPEKVRAMAEQALIRSVKEAGAGQPEKAAAFCRDRTLPLEARLAALGEIDDQAVLRALYDPDDGIGFREKLVCRISEEDALAEIIEKEPQKPLRVAMEQRVKDPERRRAYCGRDGTHAFRYVESSYESTEGTSHIYYDGYDIYRCVYCGLTTREYTRSWHD